MKNEYTSTIGIEVHAELKTKSKMFCGCKNDPHASEPNTNICPICLAHPGTLPSVNKTAATYMVMIGQSVGGEIATYSEFDRKHYFYPDIPKAYQLSQYEFPFVKGGELAGVALTRIHLEEDTAKSLHDQGSGSVVDFNRAGVPLMELVTEPVIHDAKAAATFARELQLLLRTLGVSDANMEKGEMRVEANISVSKTETLGTKVEVKNLNSFKSVEQAIEFEIKRQIDLLESGDKIIQETRGWDENKSKTFRQRVKESADDYRYFPDPDIPKFDLTVIEEFNKSRIAEILPELPSNKRTFYRDLGLQESQFEVLVANLELDNFMKATLTAAGSDSSKIAKRAANFLTSDVVSLLNEKTNNAKLNLSYAKQFAMLMVMLESGSINSRVAKDLLGVVLLEGQNPEIFAKEKGLLQQSDDSSLEPLVAEIIAENPTVVAEFKGGKEPSIQFLVGQGMKKSKGSADPAKLAAMLKEKILT